MPENTNPEHDPVKLLARSMVKAVGIVDGAWPAWLSPARGILHQLGQCDPSLLAAALGPDAVAEMALSLDDERFLGVVEQRWTAVSIDPELGTQHERDESCEDWCRPVFAPPIKGECPAGICRRPVDHDGPHTDAPPIKEGS